MRQVIPKEISEMNKKIIPYMRFVDGKGMVLADDAPLEIKELKRKVDKWFNDHDRD